MRKIVLLLILLAIPTLSYAQEDQSFRFSFGPSLGGDVNVLKSFGGGFATQLSHHYNDNLSAFVQGEYYYTTYSFTNYHDVILNVGVQYSIVKEIYVKGAVGYNLVIAQAGNHFNRTTPGQNKGYHGFTGEFHIGQDFKIGESWSFAPELGVIYSRVGGINRIRPHARAYFGYSF